MPVSILIWFFFAPGKNVDGDAVERAMTQHFLEISNEAADPPQREDSDRV